MTQHACRWGVCLALLSLAGCCGPSRPTTLPVTGTVTLDGQPVAEAAVQFIPQAGGNPAQGVTDAAGNFKLTTFVDGDGALPGAHKVTVQKNRVTGVVSNPDGLETGGATSVPIVVWDTPEKFAQPDTSGLTAEVVRGMAPVQLNLQK